MTKEAGTIAAPGKYLRKNHRHSNAPGARNRMRVLRKRTEANIPIASVRGKSATRASALAPTTAASNDRSRPLLPKDPSFDGRGIQIFSSTYNFEPGTYTTAFPFWVKS
jgi:hypothetical protein